jgi:hypothetical protein
MKILTTTILLTLCTTVSAQNGELFAKAKEHQIANIDKRISYLNELKSCISGSSEKESVKKCREEHKTKMETLKEGNESWKEGMKTERKTKR